MVENERLIAEIVNAQEQLQRLFAYDRSDPLFTSQLTIPQLKILLSLSRLESTSGSELAGLMDVSLATLSGMVDRLEAHGLVGRQEDPRDRRVRRITLTPAGAELVGGIMTAGAARQRRLLDRLDLAELQIVEQAMTLLVRAAAADLDPADAPPACRHPAERP